MIGGNKMGRHFIIGDVHGHYTCLMNLLKKLNIQEDDKVYFVGDFLDRAPSAEEQKKLIEWCIENIDEHGQYASVLGNHEEIFHTVYREAHGMALMEGHEADTARHYELCESIDNHYGLFTSLSGKNVDYGALDDLICELPVYIAFEVNGHNYLVTHSWMLDDEGVDITEQCSRNDSGDLNINIIKSIETRNYLLTKPNGYTVIHGHTPTTSSHLYWSVNPMHEPIALRIGNNINIDTCCFKGNPYGNLTAYCVESDSFIYLYDYDIDEM